jgi:hypothetical protein
MRTIGRRNWFIKRIALGFAVAAFVAPVAQASVSAQMWPGVNPGDSVAASVKAPDNHVLGPSPHDPALARGGNGSSAHAHKPHRLGGALARGDSQASWSLIAPLVADQLVADQRSANGFDWGDAGIGASLVLALVLLSGGAVVLTRHAGREQTA